MNLNKKSVKNQCRLLTTFLIRRLFFFLMLGMFTVKSVEWKNKRCISPVVSCGEVMDDEQDLSPL